MATSSARARREAAECEALDSSMPLEVDDIVAENMPLVRYIAARIAATIPASVEMDDLIQTGTVGLIDAIRRYDPAKGIPFPVYARYRIRGAILDALRALDWATRSERSRRKACASAATADGSVDSGPAQFQVFSLGPVVSLSSRRETDEEIPARDVPCGENLHPDRLFEAHEAHELVSRALNVLPDRYRRVVVMYYSGNWSMRDIGRSLGVNESRVSQIHKAALGKMKRALSGETATLEEVAC